MNSTTGLVLVPPEYHGHRGHCGTRQHRGRRHTTTRVLVINLDHADQMPELLKKVGKDHKDVL